MKVFTHSLLAGALAGCLLAGAAQASMSELADAAVRGEVERASALIAAGVDVNRQELDGSTALHWAIYHQHPALVDLLLEAGADPNRPNREGMPPLSLAATTANADIVARLLEAGADVNATFHNGETPLMMAARTGHVATIERLLAHGADIDARENLRGTTALMWAAAYSRTPALKALLAAGADFNQASALTPPGRAVRLAPTARSRIQAFFNSTREGGGAAQLPGEGTDADFELSREQLLAFLPPELVEDFTRESERGARPPARQWGGLTALHFAAREGRLDAVQALIEAGADVNQQSEYGWTPLLVATNNRYYRLGQYLLEQGADPNLSNGGGWNPLYLATDNRNIEGGDYPTRKPDMDHLDYIELLLQAGADVNLRMASSTENRTVFTNQWLDEDGATPFWRAAQSSDLALMRLLLEHGADPNINARDGVTPLMVASGIGWVEGITYEWSEEANRETIALLLELGNDPNARDFVDGRTALMGAAHKGRNYAVEMLVDAGADLAARDIGSRDSIHRLSGVTWQAIDYAAGLVRIGVQSAVEHPQTEALIRRLMVERGLEVPPEGRTLESICIVDVCR